MPRSIEDAIRIRQRQLEELQREINALQAAKQIMDAEEVPAGISMDSEPRGIPNLAMATEQPVKGWP